MGRWYEIRGQAIKAFIVLRKGSYTETLKEELIDSVKKRVSPHVAPRHVEFLDEMPMTATSKIMRRELRLLHEKKV